MSGMSRHERPIQGETNEWYTPPELFTALGMEFDLDPAAPPGGVPWVPATRSLSKEEDGLGLPWEGRVWLNPPYGPQTTHWLRRLAEHGNGLALVFARTETAWWHAVVPSAAAVCFVKGRLHFLRSDGKPSTSNAGAPSALIAYGEDCARSLAASGLGMTFSIRSQPLVQSSLGSLLT